MPMTEPTADETTTEPGQKPTLGDDYPTTCPHGVDLRFFADGEELACFACWMAAQEGR